MGKYDKVLAGLTAEVRGDGTFRDRVDEAKRKLPHGLDAASLAEMYGTLRQEKSELEERESDLNVRIAAVEEAMWGAFEDRGVSSIKLKTGRSVRVQPEPVAKVTDKDALRTWAVEQGLERLLGLPWQTVNSMAKERLLAGDAPPDGVEVQVRTKTVFSKK